MARRWRSKTQVRCSRYRRLHRHRVGRGENVAGKGAMGLERDGELPGTGGDQNPGTAPGMGLCVDPVADGPSDWTIWKNPVANQSPVLVLWWWRG